MSAWSTVHEKIVVDVVACSALMVLADEHSWEVTHLYHYILYTHTDPMYNINNITTINVPSRGTFIWTFGQPSEYSPVSIFHSEISINPIFFDSKDLPDSWCWSSEDTGRARFQKERHLSGHISAIRLQLYSEAIALIFWSVFREYLSCRENASFLWTLW